MVHGGHKFFNDKASYDGCQIALTLHFACKDFDIMIWKEENNRAYGQDRVNCYNPSYQPHIKIWPYNALLGPVHLDLAAWKY